MKNENEYLWKVKPGFEFLLTDQIWATVVICGTKILKNEDSGSLYSCQCSFKQESTSRRFD